MAENAAAAAAAPAPAPTRPAVLDDLVTDLARIVFASTLDRHNYNFAIRSLMMSSAFDQSIAEQFMFYGDSSVLKMRTAAQKFLDRISQVELQDVAEINALQIVYEVVEKIKTRMQTMVMPCEVEVIFDVLYAAVALMDDKTRTPFVAKFVHDVENVTEYITAGESVERFINDVQQEREHILAARGWSIFLFFFHELFWQLSIIRFSPAITTSIINNVLY